MFEPKIGSDACIVLTGQANTAGTEVTLEQNMEIDDMVKASDTRIILLKMRTPNNDSFAIVTFTVYNPAESTFYFTGVTASASKIVVALSKSNDVWTGTITTLP
ncbi:MAG: hypothetical protein IJI41_06975 [Anaerolineaceae bacterium]|nr:hypothetical protein [Anaerolineaceae bacterium]